MRVWLILVPRRLLLRVGDLGGWPDGCGPRRCRPVWRSGRGSCCWPRRACRTPRSPSGSGCRRPTVNLWRARYAERGSGRVGRRAAAGPAADGGPATDRHRDADAAAEESGGDALVVAGCWPTGWGSSHATVARGVEGVRGAAVEGGDVQVLHRPRAGGQGHRRRRAVSGAAGERDRAVRRREVPDPGAEPDPEDAADAARSRRATHPRLRPARHHHLVRRAGDRHRQGHRAVQEPAPPPGVPGLPQTRRPRLPRPASCTW